jgi:hypothetical protein
MRPGRFIAPTALVALSIAAGIAAALRLTRPKLLQYHFASINPAHTSIASQVTYPSQHSGPTASASLEDTQANILELRKASTDFVGYWGGYIRSSMQRLKPDLIGTSPYRASVIFGRENGTIFIASELYTSPGQKIVGRPRAKVIRARTAVIEYQATDNRLYYSFTHRFQLDGASVINYQSRVDVYDRSSRTLLGIVTGRATLKRLLTRREQLEFARPSRVEVPRVSIWATAEFGRH